MRSVIDKKDVTLPSPFGNWLKPILRKVERGGLTIEFVIREDMTNPLGILHGGVIAGMMDDSIGSTIYSLGAENFFVSLDLSIDYYAKSHIKERVLLVTNVIKEGKNLLSVECALKNMKGWLLAKGTSKLLKIEKQVPEMH